MNVKTADIKELESYYEKSGNQLVVLYGRKDCKQEVLLLSLQTGFCTGSVAHDGERNHQTV